MRLASKVGKQVTARGTMGRLWASGLISGLRDVLSHSEVGPRLMEFEAAHRVGTEKWGSAKDANILATCAAKDVTVNFSRSGSTGAAINEVVLFYNAAVQSADKLARAAGLFEAAPWTKDDRRSKSVLRTLARGATFLTLAAMMNYLRNRDDEWWKELPPYEKWNYIHIGMGGKRIARIPLPFEAGAIFGSLPIAMLEDRRSPGAFAEALNQAVSGASPIDVRGENAQERLHSLARNIAGIGPIADVVANRDWKGSNIVSPAALRYLSPEDQVNSNTSELAKMIGRHVPGGGMSPAQIDHLLNGYTGGLYRRLIGALETASDPSRIGEGGDLSTLPVAGTLFLRHGTSRLAGDFYSRLDTLRQKKGSGKASLAEIGELTEGAKIERGLSELWAARREAGKVDADKITEDANAILREHGRRSDFDRIGTMSLLLSATDQDAADAEKDAARRLLAGRDDLYPLLTSAVARRGDRTRQRGENGKLTAFGRRVARLRGLGIEQ